MKPESLMPSTSKPSVQLAGHLLVRCLIEQGVTHVFGVPGESYLAALDGFYAERERIQFITCRQEGGAAFMADASARLSGRPGVCFVTRGPGATNASIGVHTAFQDSTPLVLLVGDVGADMREREAFQELDYNVLFGPSTKGMAKRVERVDCADRLPEAVARAFATALNGRPGPVVLVLPEDMLATPTDAPALARVEAAKAACAPTDLVKLAQMLSQAQRPFVIAGGAGWTRESAQALQHFAETWALPVGNAFRYQDCFDNHHPLYAGDVGIGINPKLAQRIKDSDLILSIGARLGEMTTSGYTLLQAPRSQQKLIHIHASAEELNRVYQADLALCASMSQAALDLAALPLPQAFANAAANAAVAAASTPSANESLANTASANIPWQSWTNAAHADYLSNLLPQALPGDIDMPSIVATLQKHLPTNAVLTNGAGNFASWTHRFFKHHGLVKGFKTQLAPTVGAMGYGVPAGVAASLLGRTALTMAGDGDFLMNGQELATAVQHHSAATGKHIIVLLNNGSFGTIRMHQERHYPQRISGSALHNPGFAELAQAYGYRGVRITRTAEFEPALLQALQSPGGSLIEVMLDTEVITTRGTLSSITAAALKTNPN
jgi:acetolactate synthase I/II/III large subunit